MREFPLGGVNLDTHYTTLLDRMNKTPYLGSTSSAASVRTPASPVRLYSRGQIPAWTIVDGCSLLRLPLTPPLARLRPYLIWRQPLACLQSSLQFADRATQLVRFAHGGEESVFICLSPQVWPAAALAVPAS